MMTLMEDFKSSTSSIVSEKAEIKMIRQEITMLVSMGNVQHVYSMDTHNDTQLTVTLYLFYW